MLFRVLLVLSLVNLSACSYFTKRRNPSQETKVMLKDDQGNAKEAPAQASSTGAKELTPINPNEAEAAAQAQEMKEAVAEAAAHVQASHGKAEREAGPVSAEKALGWLRNGNTRFMKGSVRKDGASTKDRVRLAQGQKPHSIILSCSDSRVPPEVVFDQKLGEVFVIRTAGESVDNNVIGSIEYAVSHLGSNLIVVMGHESCGGVRATLDAISGAQMPSPALTGLVNDLKPRLLKFKGVPQSPGLFEEGWSNVDGIARDLVLRSEILRDAVTSGEVKIVRAMYHLESGNVEFK
ncbi:carbonic anhydrase [Bdellovibrio svalbardensis]|uniref:Carbonic anhydrase n=1 Tax=Bdellovibrio svalbardensis TaxID=2972972 RepID=A0ABT6DKD2_9BACT|nr:carbonic anhydrase [Bdellovibrio svalbardensis]MDG0817320.1 carbonic anhydrase [Bdellovibrio svalbardensis]